MLSSLFKKWCDYEDYVRLCDYEIKASLSKTPFIDLHCVFSENMIKALNLANGIIINH